MLKIDPAAFARATEALMIAARSCTDQDGMKVFIRLPQTLSPQGRPGTASSDVNPLADTNDYQRIRACLATVAAADGS